MVRTVRASNPPSSKMRVEPLLLMKMKYDGVFYESNSGVGKSIQMFENATKT